MTGNEFLAYTKINAVMKTLRDIREVPSKLIALNRTPVVNALDGEIVARYERNAIVADIVADDQEATTTRGMKITLEQQHIPNIKKGTIITQEMQNLLARINAGGGIPQDDGIFSDYIRQTISERLDGIRIRMNQMIYGMWLDAFSYDKDGIKLVNVSWGMPSDLKVTPSNLWTDATNATPISDIRNTVRLASEKYGESYDRITLSTTAFNNLTATTEFRNKAALYAQFVLPTAGTFPTNDVGLMKGLIPRLLDGMQVEIEDYQFQEEAKDASRSFTKFLPTNKVILGTQADDNNGAAMDFANGVVTESLVASMPGMSVVGGGAIPYMSYGPIAYVTAKPDLNPPQATIWGVARGFPRKKRLSATAVLTVA